MSKISNQTIAPFQTARVLRAALPGLLVWGAIVLVSVVGRQPGAVCLTPMAWLLALVGGIVYAKPLVQSGQRPGLPALAAIGAITGVFMAVSWLIVSSMIVPANAPAIEIEKQRNLDFGMSAASVVLCTLLAIVGGKITRR